MDLSQSRIGAEDSYIPPRLGNPDSARPETALAAIGIDFEDVVDDLEKQGLASFAKSWDELIASVTSQLEKAGAEVMPAGAVKPTSSDPHTQGAAPASAAPRETTPVY